MAVRVVREDQLGLTHARRRAVREARGALVCFLDDDTVPSPTYVATGVAAMSDPRVGLLVSRVSPEWVDHPPPPSLARRAHLFAVNEALGDAPIEWTATIAPTLGAGMWVRRQAFLECVDHSPSLMADRQGRALTSGGDIEIGCLIGRGGWRRLYVPGLRLSHRIPGRRFELSYACRLIWGIERSTATIESRYGSPPSRVKAAVGLAIAVSAAPLLLLRRDGARELVFALTRRAGRLRGPL